MSQTKVFIASKEGGEFKPAFLQFAFRPKYVHAAFRKTTCVIVFKCGMVYDGNLKKPWLKIKSPWRHKLAGGRRVGKQYYKDLTYYFNNRPVPDLVLNL